MRESCSYGSVRERGGNEPLYSEDLIRITTIYMSIKKEDRGSSFFFDITIHIPLAGMPVSNG